MNYNVGLHRTDEHTDKKLSLIPSRALCYE